MFNVFDFFQIDWYLYHTASITSTYLQIVDQKTVVFNHIPVLKFAKIPNTKSNYFVRYLCIPYHIFDIECKPNYAAAGQQETKNIWEMHL